MPRIGQSNIDIHVRTDADTKGFDKAGKGAESLGKRMGLFGKAAIAAVGVAATGAVIKFGKESLRVFAEEETINKKLTQLVLNQKGATMKNVESLMAQADALENVGVVSAGNIKTAQAQLQMFDLSTDAIQKLIPSLLDMAVAERGVNVSQGELQGLANGVGKAMQGQMDILRKMGFVFSDAQVEMLKTASEEEKLNFITGLIASTYADMNVAMKDTFEGRMATARMHVEKFKESMGKLLTNIISPIVGWFNDRLIPAFKAFGEWISTSVTPRVVELWAAFKERVLPTLTVVWSFIKENFIKAWEELRAAIEPHKAQLLFLAKILGGALLVAIGVVLISIGLLLGTLVLLWTGLMKVVTWVLNAKKAVEDFARAFGLLLGLSINEVRSRFEGAFSAISSVINEVKNAINRIIDGWNRLRAALGVPVSGSVQINQNAAPSASRLGVGVTRQASGGFASAGLPKIVGERGPELFVPNQSGTVVPNSKLGGMGAGRKFFCGGIGIQTRRC